MFENAIIAQNSHWQETGAEVGIPRDVLDKIKGYLDIPHIISDAPFRQNPAGNKPAALPASVKKENRPQRCLCKL